MFVTDIKLLYYCEKCRKTFDTNEDYLTHTETHFDQGFSCDVCSMRFDQIDDLERHGVEHQLLKSEFLGKTNIG